MDPYFYVNELFLTSTIGLYSIDGTTFQEENTFLDLPTGEYLVTVRDELGCELSHIESITISSTLEKYIPFSIYPNPVETEFIINAGNNIDAEKVVITNLKGEIILQYDYKQTMKINLFSLAQGLYFVVLKDRFERIISVEKLVKIGTNRA